MALSVAGDLPRWDFFDQFSDFDVLFKHFFGNDQINPDLCLFWQKNRNRDDSRKTQI